MTDFNASHDRMTTEVARHWIARLASGDISEQEMAFYKLWVTNEKHHEAFQHELKLWRSLNQIADSLAPNTPIPVQAASMKQRRRRIVVASVSAIAACVALLLTVPDIAMHLRADDWTTNHIEALVLPDGSHVVLDADTALAVHYKYGARNVALLRGRAWFDVKHDAEHPFRVETGGSITEDIGTAFEIDRRMTDERVETAVQSGSVRVSSRDNDSSVILTAGQRAVWRGNHVSRETDIAPDSVASWRDGQLMLASVSVRSAVQTIARYRNGRTFILGDINDLPPITALVDAHNPDDALAALASGTSIALYHLPGDIVIVRRKN